MRCLISAIAFLSLLPTFAKEMADTVWTRQNDKIILTYNVSSDGNQMSIDFSRPRIIPSSTVNKACKGEIDKLKVVVFDRVGDFVKTKWSGLSPEAFMVPSGLSYDKTSDGYYILGESQPIEFLKLSEDNSRVKMPVYIAVYDKKQNYRIVAVSKSPLNVSTSTLGANRSGHRDGSRSGLGTERIEITSREELDAENGDITRALSSIDMVRELLSRETEVPFSQALQMEIYNLRSMKNQIKESEVVNKINDVLLMCSDKEYELKEAQNQSAQAAKAQEQALQEQQKQEAEAQQKAAEEKAKEQEEKQQRRTLWMIIGGVVVAILAFIGNAIFKHFRDLRNQKSIMQMQESLARQAEHEAGRRTREIVRNKAHQVANQGKNKLRNSINGNAKNKVEKQTKNNKPRSI